MSEVKIKEEKGKQLTEIELLTTNVTILSNAVETLNNILLVLLYNNKDLKIPEWNSKEDVEKELGAEIRKCVEAVRKTYGPGETDKS